MIATLAQKKALIRNDLAEIKRAIRRVYPDAIFQILEDPELAPRALWMNVYSDAADGDTLTDLILERGLQLLERKHFLLTVHARPRAYLPVSKTRRAANGNRAARERRTPYQVKRSKRKERTSL